MNESERQRGKAVDEDLVSWTQNKRVARALKKQRQNKTKRRKVRDRKG